MIMDRIIQLMLLLSVILLLLVTGFLLIAIGAVVPGFLDELFILGLIILFLQWLWHYRDASGRENFFVREIRKIYLSALTKEIRGKVIDFRGDRGFFVLQSGTKAYRFPIKSLSEPDRSLLHSWIAEDEEVLMIVYLNLLTRQLSHYEFPLNQE